LNSSVAIVLYGISLQRRSGDSRLIRAVNRSSTIILLRMLMEYVRLAVLCSFVRNGEFVCIYRCGYAFYANIPSCMLDCKRLLSMVVTYPYIAISH